MVELPQQILPYSSETTITGEPSLERRIFGPDEAIGSPLGPITIYTVPAGMRATLTMLLATNIDPASPPATGYFSISVGADAENRRLFNNSEVDPGTPMALGLALTLEEGEFLQALTTNVTLTLNAKVETA